MSNDNINHPAHYAGYNVNIECIDITRHLPFDLGNAVKYIWRAGRKGDSKIKEAEDLRKAIWYLSDHLHNPKYNNDYIKHAEPMILLLVRQLKHDKVTPPFIAEALEMILGGCLYYDKLILLLLDKVKVIENSPEYKAEILLDKMTGEDKR